MSPPRFLSLLVILSAVKYTMTKVIFTYLASQVKKEEEESLKQRGSG